MALSKFGTAVAWSWRTAASSDAPAAMMDWCTYRNSRGDKSYGGKIIGIPQEKIEEETILD